MATFPTAESRYTPPLDAPGILLAEELSEIAERAQLFTSATGVMIALRRSHELVVRTSNGVAPEVGACIPLPSGVTGLCVTTKKPQTCASADAEAQLEAAFRAIGVRAVLSVPVPWNGEVRGVLAVLSQMPEAFNRTHVAILMTLRDVIAHKLSQCELPAEAPRQTAPAELVEIDVDSLLKAPAPAPTVVAPKPAAPAPHKASAVPAQAFVAVAPRWVEPIAATPAAEPKLPVVTALPSAAPAKPLAELLKEPAEPPAVMSPDVLCPGDDPSKYGSVPKPKPVVRPEVFAAPAAVASSPNIFAVYRAPGKSSRKNVPVFGGAAAAIVLLGVGIAFYAWHKPAPSSATPRVAVQESTAPAPEPSVVAVSLPRSAGEQPPAAAPLHAASAMPPANREEATLAALAKPVAEKPAQKPVPALQLASGKPVAKAEEEIEPPALGVMQSAGKAMPNLASVPVATASLAARPSALVPATLLQGRPPQYPEAARRTGVSGTVRLHISISAAGKVTDVSAVGGDPLLRQASISAVREWVYRPAYLDGNPVSSTADVTLKFNTPR